MIGYVIGFGPFPHDNAFTGYSTNKRPTTYVSQKKSSEIQRYNVTLCQKVCEKKFDRITDVTEIMIVLLPEKS